MLVGSTRTSSSWVCPGQAKTTVGRALARRLERSFAEGDEFHPAANREKIAAGFALDDADRWPWLAALRDWMTAQYRAGEQTVVACSALRRAYRDVLRSADGQVLFVELDVATATLAQRINERQHFMPTSLLSSQLGTLEPLACDEYGARVESAAAADQTVERIMSLPALQA